MNTLFNNANVAKIAGWVGGFLNSGAAAKQFGKYDALAAAVGSLLIAWALHNASNTSK